MFFLRQTESGIHYIYDYYPSKYRRITGDQDLLRRQIWAYKDMDSDAVTRFTRDLISAVTLISRDIRLSKIGLVAVPPSKVYINHAISERTEYGLERVVAQAAALGEEEYAQYLNQELSKMCRSWKEKDAIPYGVSLRKWAVNTREYNWLRDNFPADTPGTKGAYTKAKNKQTLGYIKLKRLASGKGYELIDDVEAYLN